MIKRFPKFVVQAPDDIRGIYDMFCFISSPNHIQSFVVIVINSPTNNFINNGDMVVLHLYTPAKVGFNILKI